MLPAELELRPSLQLSDKTLAVGFPGESVSDPFATGELARELPGVLARVLPEAGAHCLVVDLRNVREITGAGVFALKSMRPALRGKPYMPLLVVKDERDWEFLHATGATSHLAVVIGEDGLRAWIAEGIEAEKEFSPENLQKMRDENITLADVLAALERHRG